MRANVYIRVENEDAWLALDNKSEWLNAKLTGTLPSHISQEMKKMYAEAVPVVAHRVIEASSAISASDRLVESELPEDTQKAIRIINASPRPRASAATIDFSNLEDAPIITPRNKDMNFCKHNAVKGFCKKGCR